MSLPRRDSKTGVGHTGFEVIADPDATIAEASGRRDSTINALMWGPKTGDVIDCWGGLGDLERGVLRHTTEAFAEDPLRVLRGAQFAARFGFTMDPETVELCRTLTGEYASLSEERVWVEWHKIATKAPARPPPWRCSPRPAGRPTTRSSPPCTPSPSVPRQADGRFWGSGKLGIFGSA